MMKYFSRLLTLSVALFLTACAITSPDIKPTAIKLPTRITNATQVVPPTASAPSTTPAPLSPSATAAPTHTFAPSVTASETLTPSATSIQPTATPTITLTPTSTASPAPTLTPTATPVPVGFGFIARVNPKDAPIGALEISAYEGAKAAADSFSLRVDAEYIGAGDLETAVKKLADGKHPVIVVAGYDLSEATRRVASAYPFVKFVGVNHSADEPAPTNVYVIQTRADEEGFIAGMVGGYVSKARVLSALVPNNDNLLAKRYGNGFIQGVRYSCGICQTSVTQFDVERDTAAVVLPRLQRQKVDMVFTALQGDLGAEVTKFALTTGGLWVVGVGRDYGSTLSDARLALSVWRKSDIVVAETIKSAMKGEPPKPVWLSATNGALRLSEKISPEVSPAVAKLIKDSFDLLANGSLEVGLEWASGEVK